MNNSAGRLSVDLGAIAANYHFLKQKCASSRVAAVMKADAYGLGAEEIAPVLYAAGCRDYFVAVPDEGAALRPYVSSDSRIYILNGYYGSQSGLYLSHDLIPVLGHFAEMQAYKSLAVSENRALPAYLNFNIRMNRLGFGEVETDELLQDPGRLDGLDVIGVMSHFASAEDPADPLSEKQYGIFKEISAHFPWAEKSLSNSAGIFRNAAYHFDLVRPGMALYGLNPRPGQANPMQPVVSLSVPVIRRRLVYKGARVGYNATYQFEKDTQIATLSAGYADGLFRALSNKGILYYNGYACPIRGRVSMDLTTVDLSAVPEDQLPVPGDFMEVIGPHQSADDLAAAAGTIGYEILTALGSRYERRYIKATEHNLKSA